jgi:hypothetical protein
MSYTFLKLLFLRRFLPIKRHAYMPCIRPVFILLLDAGKGRESQPNFLRQLTTEIPLSVFLFAFLSYRRKIFVTSFLYLGDLRELMTSLTNIHIKTSNSQK